VSSNIGQAKYMLGARSTGMASLAVLLTCQLGCASGTGSLVVTVTDELGGGLPGAVVTVGSLSGETNLHGTAYFSAVPAGKYPVAASIVGFRPCEPVAARVRSDKEAKATVRLQMKAAHGPDETGPCRPKPRDVGGPAKLPSTGA